MLDAADIREPEPVGSSQGFSPSIRFQDLAVLNGRE